MGDAAKEVADAHAAWKAKYGAQERPGPPTCQTMLLKMETSTSKHQHQSRRLLLIKPRLRRRPRKPPTQKLRKRLPQLKPPQLSSSSTEEETLPKRDPPNHLNPNLNHQDPTLHHQATAHHQDLTEHQLDHIAE